MTSEGAPPQAQYVYRTRLVRVVDGDSCVLDIDLGCHVTITRPVRLLGVDTPEVVGTTRAAGVAAQVYATTWLTGRRLVVETQLDKNDKFGRLLATIYRSNDPISLNESLITDGHAVAYDGGQR